MSETLCEESNLSHCKGVSSKAFDEAEEREYEVVNLRRAINIVAYLVMSVGMTGNIFNSFIANFQTSFQANFKGTCLFNSRQARVPKFLSKKCISLDTILALANFLYFLSHYFEWMKKVVQSTP